MALQPELEAKVRQEMNTQLKAQVVFHEEGNLYACKYCDKRFTLQSSAKRHEKKSCMKKPEIQQTDLLLSSRSVAETQKSSTVQLSCT